LVEINTSASIEIKRQILVGKGKYMCKYYNEAPKFQLVEVSISMGIASLNEESTLNAIPTCMVTSK
jgi:hypothetical protein